MVQKGYATNLSWKISSICSCTNWSVYRTMLSYIHIMLHHTYLFALLMNTLSFGTLRNFILQCPWPSLCVRGRICVFVSWAAYFLIFFEQHALVTLPNADSSACWRGNFSLCMFLQSGARFPSLSFTGEGSHNKWAFSGSHEHGGDLNVMWVVWCLGGKRGGKGACQTHTHTPFWCFPW